jgi:hypothetical protein
VAGGSWLESRLLPLNHLLQNGCITLGFIIPDWLISMPSKTKTHVSLNKTHASLNKTETEPNKNRTRKKQNQAKPKVVSRMFVMCLMVSLNCDPCFSMPDGCSNPPATKKK